MNDFLFSDLGNDFYSQDIIKNNNFFIPKNENKMNIKLIFLMSAFKIDVERSEDNFVRLFLINKKTNKKTKILEEQIFMVLVFHAHLVNQLYMEIF